MKPPLTTHARRLVYELLDLMPSVHQRASLKAMLALFLETQGTALPEHATHKSPSALSRFLNLYNWPTASVIRILRREILRMLLERRKVGRRPILRTIVDLTPLQKSGQFERLGSLVRVLNNKRGLQLVVLYLELDGWRVPWSNEGLARQGQRLTGYVGPQTATHAAKGAQRTLRDYGIGCIG
jgi:hypothetical protein